MSIHVKNDIEVKDFTRPVEKNSTHGIRCAIEEAIRTATGRVLFEPGKYVSDSTVFFKTEGMTHDNASQTVQLFGGRKRQRAIPLNN